MSQRQREYRELKEQQKKTLKALQWLAKNQYRAPEELQGTWDEVLGDLDIYAVSAANEMRYSKKYDATWKDLAEMYKDAQENDPNFLPSKELEKIVHRLDNKKIADMDLNALQDLYKAAVGLRTEFYNRNNVINDDMNRLFAEVYTDSKKELDFGAQTKAGEAARQGKKLDSLFNQEQLSPMNVMQRMAGWNPNSAWYSMAKQLEKGERDIRDYTVSATKQLREFLTEHEDWAKKADGQGDDGIWYEVKIPQLVGALEVGKPPKFGDTITVWMTPTQKVHMYLESKSTENLRHMEGGRTFADKTLYSQGKRRKAFAQGKTVRMAPGDREGNRRQLNAGRTGAGTGAGAILQRVCQEGDQPRFQHSLRVRQGCEQKLYADLHQLQLHQERAGCLRRNGRRRRQSEEPPVLQESELQHRRLRRL